MNPPHTRTLGVLLLLCGCASIAAAQAEQMPRGPNDSVTPIDQWLVRGPYPLPKGDDPLQRAAFDEAKERPAARRPWTAVRWPRATLQPFRAAEAKEEPGFLYVAGYVHVREAKTVRFWVNSEGPYHALLHGQTPRFEAREDQEKRAWDSAPVELQPGAHSWLIKVARTGSRDVDLSVRFSDIDGNPARDVVTSITATEPSALDWIRANAELMSTEELFSALPLVEKFDCDFDQESDLEQLVIVGASHTYLPVCLLGGKSNRTWDGLAAPDGARGIFASHPRTADAPLRLLCKLHLPARSPRLELRAAPEARKSAGAADWSLRVTAFDGETTHAIGREVVGPRGEPARAQWIDFEFDLSALADRDVLLEIECAGGGPRGAWHFEQVFFDLIRVRS